MPADRAVGLTSAEVAAARERFGWNTLPEARRRTFLRALLAQFGDVMVMLLIVAGAIAAVVGETADLVAIAVIVILNAVLGAVQEHRAERARASLRALATPTARVRRDGRTITLPAGELVPGDVVLVEAGNLVPRPPTESVLAHGLWQHILWVGTLIGLLTLAIEAIGLRSGSTHWRTMTFTVLTFTQMAHVLAIRSERDSLFHQGLLSNRELLGAVGLTVGLQFAILYFPPLQPLFRTEGLSLGELAPVIGAAAIVFAAVELEKLLRRSVRA